MLPWAIRSDDVRPAGMGAAFAAATVARSGAAAREGGGAVLADGYPPPFLPPSAISSWPPLRNRLSENQQQHDRLGERSCNRRRQLHELCLRDVLAQRVAERGRVLHRGGRNRYRQ